MLGWIPGQWRPGGFPARGAHLGMSIRFVTLHPDAKIFWRTSALSYINIYNIKKTKKQLVYITNSFVGSTFNVFSHTQIQKKCAYIYSVISVINCKGNV